MSVAFYMDHHVKAAVTAGLRRRDVDVITCAEDRTDMWEDERVFERATQLNRTVFSPDDDFLAIADQWLSDGREFAGLVYAHQLGITIGQAVRDIELIAKALTPEEMRNRIVFLPLD